MRRGALSLVHWIARARFALYAARLLAARAALVVGVALVGGLLYRARDAAAPDDLVAASYFVYTQLFFEHLVDLPDDGLLRVIFFVAPITGAFVLGEGLIKLGASLLDFRYHRDTWVRIMATSMKNHVVLVGLGHVGFRVLEDLLRRDADVVVIEKAGDSPFVEEARARSVPLLIGHASRDAILREANVAGARAVVACTDDDLVNLEVALDARRLQPKIRVVMRMFDQTLAEKIGGAFAVNATLSTSTLAAPVFASAALDERVYGAYKLGDTLMVVTEIVVPDGGPRRTVRELEAAIGTHVVGVRRQGSAVTHRFAPTETLSAGDALVAHTPAADVEALHARLRPPPSA